MSVWPIGPPAAGERVNHSKYTSYLSFSVFCLLDVYYLYKKIVKLKYVIGVAIWMMIFGNKLS
jgi:hypothetical protein